MARILVVDDSAVVRRMLRLVLEKTGHQVSFAEDGQAGLAAARTLLPDLVISDLEMPVMDGLAMVGQLRADPAVRDIPVIVLTASGESDHHRAIADSGVAGFATKPIRSNEITELVETILRAG